MRSLSICICVSVQATIQMAYLMYSGTGSWNIIFSALFSFIMLTYSVTGYDAEFLKWKPSGAKKAEYFKLLAFRLSDVPSRIMNYALLWFIGMGWVTALILAINALIGLTISMMISEKFCIF